MQRPVYIAIDLKSYYASVECVERGEDPLTFNLLVADESRTDKTICLAVSPSLKAMGVPSRPRLFEARQAIRLYEAAHHTKVQYVVAKPQMALSRQQHYNNLLDYLGNHLRDADDEHFLFFMNKVEPVYEALKNTNAKGLPWLLNIRM